MSNILGVVFRMSCRMICGGAACIHPTPAGTRRTNAVPTGKLKTLSLVLCLKTRVPPACAGHSLNTAHANSR